MYSFIKHVPSPKVRYAQYLGNSAYMAFDLATAHKACSMNPRTAVCMFSVTAYRYLLIKGSEADNSTKFILNSNCSRVLLSTIHHSLPQLLQAAQQLCH